jgi:hypothetical protein
MSQRFEMTRSSFLREQPANALGIVAYVGGFSSTMSNCDAFSLAVADDMDGVPKTMGEKYALNSGVTDYHHSALNKPQLISVCSATESRRSSMVCWKAAFAPGTRL